MFLINVGELSGIGIPKILAVWEKEGLKPPTLTECFAPEHTCLEAAGGNKSRRYRARTE